SPDHLAVHPDGHVLAVSCDQPPGVDIVDLNSGKIVKQLPHAAGVQGLAWSPTDKTLAAACKDHRIYIWDTSRGTALKTLGGHEWEVYLVQFNHSGDLLISEGFDSTTRVWNVRTGKHLVQHPLCRWIGFGIDDRVAGAWIDRDQVKLCGVDTGGGCRTL